MRERRLHYRFHDPNPEAVTAGCILKLLIEANAGKAEEAIRSAAAALPAAGGEPDRCQGHSA